MTPRIRMVQIKNYKSLASVSVELEPFTVFVGPNGSGKSNFIDALAFVQECLSESVEIALSKRAGILNIISRHEHRSPLTFIQDGSMPQEKQQREYEHLSESAAGVGFRLLLDLGEDLTADYSVRMVVTKLGGFFVGRERCVIQKSNGGQVSFDIRFGRFEEPIPGLMPYVAADRLALFAASATEEFRPVYDFLASMRFYSIVPDVLRSPQNPDIGYDLKKDGSNAAAVLRNILRLGPDDELNVNLIKLLGSITEGIEGMNVVPYGTHEAIAFLQNIGLRDAQQFPALNMSDGTLRTLGVLLAVYQLGRPTVIGIEDPEATVHPAVTEIVMEVLLKASEERQLLITTHSPDIVEYHDLRAEQLRLVSWHRGRTIISTVPETLRNLISDRLYSKGELLSAGEMRLDDEELDSAVQEIDLFGPPFNGIVEAK
jgi:predicted ATPase